MSIEGTELLKRMRSDAGRLFDAAVKRVDPYEAVKRFVRFSGGRLALHPDGSEQTPLSLESFEHVYVIGGGKASAPMAKALEEILGERISGGLIVVKYGFTEPLKFLEIIEAGHPLPDGKGVEGAGRILEILQGAGEKDLILSLISGGGSALLPLPAGGITLAEKQAVTRMLLDCGATIGEINAVRKHISSSKGGQMARAAFPATTINLMLSDVVGDRLDVIASGPFVPDSSTFQDAWSVIEKYRLKGIPSAVREYLEKGMKGEAQESPKAGDPVFEKVRNFVIGSNILALEAAEREAGKLGYNAVILSSMIEGETREVALVHTAIAKEILATGRPVPAPACVISGGETTVTIRGKGRGGRNQEFCLAAAIDIRDQPLRVIVTSGGTDGNDGPTDAAGAIIDPLTCRRGEESGLRAETHLENNDAYPYLEKTGDLLITGPTKTNVMDVRFVLVR
ncbi:MAG: glycerate kinase [Deltaproteobacteria bacterium HGW-Deltaproteobacteria-15]|nr:MAG: glycerate kinase [Deltaproteobacteria bacterium HGW-Deltaproteobacteria-15]